MNNKSTRKYHVKKDALKSLFAAAQIAMENQFHSVYQRLGWRQKGDGNFYCWNTGGHNDGVDTFPSLSVDNNTGKWQCFTCGISGNFQSYWSDYLKGGEYGEHYTDFVIDFCNLQNTFKDIPTNKDDPNFEDDCENIQKLYDSIQSEYYQKTGKPYILPSELADLVKKMNTSPMSELDVCVKRLLKDEDRLLYLNNTRNITIDLINKYQIGLDERRRIVFPIIDGNGDLVNLKSYDPWNTNQAYKWVHKHRGRDMKATPIGSLMASHITFFEGEPDAYCALAFGIDGAVTMGSKSITNILKMFSKKECQALFGNKDFVICFDSDKAGRDGALKLAHSLYPFAKQIKIIDLDKSDINKYGLDPELMKEVNGKQKRKETDFTDFMKKNGFDESQALSRYLQLIKDTPVYTEDFSRKDCKNCKVTLQEARTAKYYSPNGNIKLELIASVSNFDSRSYFYWTKCKATCNLLDYENERRRSCSNCVLSCMPEFDAKQPVVFNFVRAGTHPTVTKNPHMIELSEHDILGMIETPARDMDTQQKKLLRIPKTCPFVKLVNFNPQKISHVELARDVEEFEFKKTNIQKTGISDINIHAYMIGEQDLYPNKSYIFKGIQTTAWNGQYVVLFLDEAEPIATSIEKFQMDQKTHDLFQVFRPAKGESIKKHLYKRYEAFGNAIGLDGRRELIAMLDLTFFSPIEIRNKRLLPNVTRGWVESIVAGDSRCGKTLVADFFHNHYKIGEKVDCSDAVARTGLLGGIVKFMNQNAIKWGKIPMNDGGLLTIDELANLSINQLNDLTPMRSSGIAEINKIVSGKSPARTRKIMLSNKRVMHDDTEEGYSYGINFLKDLCYKSEVLSRFDLGFVVRRDDISSNDFASSYKPIATEFTEFQCRHLIMWAYSRKPEDFIFEEGLEEYINEAHIKLLKKFHSSTELINQEMRAKLVRLSVSLATLLYSHMPNDWDKVSVTKEHVAYIVEFLNELYCHPNMKLDSYSVMKRKAETLGDMRFMMNILKYINIDILFKDEDLTDGGIKQVFIDYLCRVADRTIYMVNANSDEIKSNDMFIGDASQKLISTLITRNCIVRTKHGRYKKTKMFNNWLEKRLKEGDNAEQSDILELTASEPHLKIIETAKILSEGDGKLEKRNAS